VVQNLSQEEDRPGALRQIEDGDTIILATGTTTIELARLLEAKRNLTIVTNDLEIARLLEQRYPAGGGDGRNTTEGLPLHGFLRHSDKDALEGLSGTRRSWGEQLHPEAGSQHPDIRHAETEGHDRHRHQRDPALRLGQVRPTFVQFAKPGRSAIITDGMPEADRRKMEELGIQVIVAE
jgi:hypothetical protein